MATAEAIWDAGAWNDGNDRSSEIRYYVFYDPATEAEPQIEAAVEAIVPGVYRRCILSSINYKIDSYGKAIATAKFSRRAMPDPEQTRNAASAEYSFEIGTTQAKVVSSLEVVSEGTATGEDIPDNGTLIGVDPKDGKPEGVEVPQATFTFSEVHYFTDAEVDEAYKVALANAVGTVNFGGAWRGYAAGQVLFTGASGSKRGEDLWQIRFSFAVSPNVSGLTVGDVTGITKAGWDYIEWFYKETENATTKLLERKLTGYRVHRVMRSGGQFAALQIG